MYYGYGYNPYAYGYNYGYNPYAYARFAPAYNPYAAYGFRPWTPVVYFP